MPMVLRVVVSKGDVATASVPATNIGRMLTASMQRLLKSPTRACKCCCTNLRKVAHGCRRSMARAIFLMV